MAAKKDTEQAILDAARKVFVELGPVKARMQDIAEEADITQSLLHYYFRRRDDLYRKVFEEELQRVMPEQMEVLASDRPLREKLEVLARGMIDFHADNPHLAAFIVFETHYNDDRFEEIEAALSDIHMDALQEQIDERVEAGEMAPIEATHLLAHVFSLCLFPFIAKPVFRSMYDMEEDEYRRFIEERKQAVPDFIDRALATAPQAAPTE
jgi:AcrR family transcriptional regulator